MQKAFAFDFDGVVLDSLEALRETYFKFLSQYGVKGSEEEFASLNGPSLVEIVDILKQVHGLDGSHDSLYKRYKSLISEAYLDAPLIAGVRECLYLLRDMKFPVALVTSSIRSEVENILQRHNLLCIFDCIITGDDVKISKPSPEIYLKLSEKFPQYLWFAVEDSENGLAAAVGAGFKTIFFDQLRVGTDKQIYSKVRSMSRLKRRIEEICLGCCVVDMVSDISVQVAEGGHYLNQHMEDRVNEIWQDGLRHNSLHDGTVLYYVGHKTDSERCVISAFWGPYRYLYAKRIDPSLSIPFFPLAVSGICINDDNHVLIGLRQGVTEYPNRFEFVPSGGLSSHHSLGNTVSYAQQLVDEFEEESGLDKRSVTSIRTLGLVIDEIHNVMDICCLINVSTKLDDALDHTAEYEGLKWIEFDDANIKDFIPTSKALSNLLRESDPRFYE